MIKALLAVKQSKKSDFRYNTGDAKVPWDAVAVKPDAGLVLDVVRFLIGPGAEQVFFEHYTHLSLYGLSDDAINYRVESVIQTARELKA